MGDLTMGLIVQGKEEHLTWVDLVSSTATNIHLLWHVNIKHIWCVVTQIVQASQSPMTLSY